jgi:hypothetical protein
MLNTLYAALLAEGGRTTREADLSPRTVRYIHTINHRALKDAVKWGRLAPNPADAADPPKASAVSRPESITWTADQLRTFLEGTPFESALDRVPRARHNRIAARRSVGFALGRP